MKLEIKQEHIDEADRVRRIRDVNRPMTCPIAQALMGMGYEEVKVLYSGAIAKGYKWIVLGYSWMMDWDAGQPVYPVTLELEEKA